MKIFIAFMLLFFTNCLAPTAISATVNVKTFVAHSVISPIKKLSFKEKLLLKLSKKEAQKLTKIQRLLLIGLLLIFLGVILLAIGNSKAKSGGFFAGFEESIIGVVATSVGLLTVLTSVILSNRDKL
jgi:hypothetical protein